MNLSIPAAGIPQIILKNGYKFNSKLLQTEIRSESGNSAERSILKLDGQISGLVGNGITELKVLGDYLWIGTGDGLSVTRGDGETFYSYNHRVSGIGRGGVSAIAVSPHEVWVATAFDSLTEAGETALITGGGIAVTRDSGLTWEFFQQPVDGKDEDRVVYQPGDTVNALPVTTPIQNVTYDMAVTNSAVWIASFAGGLRKSVDGGKSWLRVLLPPDGSYSLLPGDTLNFSLNPVANLNHRVFSVMAYGDTIWVGTANGINRSFDGGISWVKFNAQNSMISGNFVVALARQLTDKGETIWAATLPAEDPSEYTAISKTRNKGATWSTTLEGERAYNFAFNDTIVYVATDRGLFKSIDGGDNWALYPNIVDFIRDQQILTSDYYTAAVTGGSTLWVGTADGLAKTADDGRNWRIIRTFARSASAGEPATYAYPNPFSPQRFNVLGERDM
ncbi:MAG: hypothetical protein ACE5QV_04655 [Fidelibacterota bacterium]